MAQEAEAAKEVVQTAPVDSAPAQDSTDDGAKAQVADEPQVQKDDGELIPQETESDKGDVADDTAETSTDETDSKPQGEELAPKSVNRFKKLADENRELKEQLDRLKLQETQLATEQELLNEINPETGDYYTPQEVERIAFAQSRQAQAQTVAQQRYALEVQQNQQQLTSEASRALEEYPMFDAQSPDYNPELAAQYDALLGQALIVENGVPVGASISPYQLAKTIAEATKINEAKNQAVAQRATEKMLANADVPSGSQRGEKAFEKLSASEMAAKLRAKGYDI